MVWLHYKYTDIQVLILWIHINSNLRPVNMVQSDCPVKIKKNWNIINTKGLWLYCSWIYNYLCNQCSSPIALWVQIPLKWGILDTTLYDKVCQWLAAGQWFPPGTLVSSTSKTEILLKVALNIHSTQIVK